MKLCELYNRADRQKVVVSDWKIPGVRKAFSVPGGIALDLRKIESTMEEKCELAHELGHVERGAFYEPKSLIQTKWKYEHQANQRGVEILMPFDEVLAAVLDGDSAPWALAERFGVTERFATMALEMYGERMRQHRASAQRPKRPAPKLMRASDLLPARPAITPYQRQIIRQAVTDLDQAMLDNGPRLFPRI